MKLYLKQKVFSWKDKSTIKDENGDDKYFVEGKVLSIGKKLTVFDTNQNEVAFIRQKVATIMPKFFVEINGEQVAQIVKKFTLLKPKYVVEDPGWSIQGNFSAHDYSINDGEKEIAVIHKKWMTWGDTFEIDIADEKDEIIILGVVLAIDAVMDDAESAAAGGIAGGAISASSNH
jgi:uncharacterized protein YxjI